MNKSTKERKFLFSEDLNNKFLEENYGTNLTLASKIFAVFLSSAKEDIQNLEQAVEQSDFTEIYQISHKVKNNFLFVGLTRISQLLTELEKKAHEKSEEIEMISNQICQLFKNGFEMVEKELQNLNAFLAS